MKIPTRPIAISLSLLFLVVSLLPASAQAQRRDSGGTVFHSTQVANLPTASTLQKGDLLFEIAHRFDAPVSDGADALWGFDGSVVYRLGLSYGVSDRVTLGIRRSNREDNLELNAKTRLWEGGGAVPFVLGAKGGVAWNTQPFAGADDNESQAYLQLLLNAGLGGRVDVGVVPTYLRNPHIQDEESDDAFALGLHGQYYFSDGFSLLAEWLVSEVHEEAPYDAGTFGLEIETRGHFFKVLLTNQVRLNPTQFLGGAPISFDPDNWRIAFNITRRIPL